MFIIISCIILDPLDLVINPPQDLQGPFQHILIIIEGTITAHKIGENTK
jgi:hypothetical protein